MKRKFFYAFFAGLFLTFPCWAKGEATLAGLAEIFAPKSTEAGQEALEKKRLDRRERAKKVVAQDEVVFPDYWRREIDKEPSAAPAVKERTERKPVLAPPPAMPQVEKRRKNAETPIVVDDEAFLREQEALRRMYEQSGPVETPPVVAEKQAPTVVAAPPVVPSEPVKKETIVVSDVKAEPAVPPCLVGRPCVLCAPEEPLWNGRQCVKSMKEEEDEEPAAVKEEPVKETRLQKFKREQRERIEKQRQERLSKKNKKKK